MWRSEALVVNVNYNSCHHRLPETASYGGRIETKGENRLKIFCWICSQRREFLMPQQSTLAVCTCCGNPEGAIRRLVPVELVIRGIEPPKALVDSLLGNDPG